MAITRNTFTKGLKKDISKEKVTQDSYEDALNVRITTDVGSSTGSIMNIKGNELMLTIPNTGNFVNIIFNSPTIASSYLVTINGISATFNYLGTPNNIYTNFKPFLETTLGFSSLNLSAFTDGTSVKLYSTSHLVLTITIPNTTITNIVGQQTNLIPIGYTSIRNDIILITTSSNNNSLTPTNTVGQIWKLTYDKSLLDTPTTAVLSFELLYNNILDLSTEYPIASPGNIIGNYENEFLQKIYWCDNYNNIRYFNVAEAEGFFKVPEELSSKPITTFDIPYLTGILNTGGNIKPGLYYFIYRYTDTGGSSTVFSPPSQLITITSMNESTANIFTNNFMFPATGIPKSIQLRIDNPNRNFDRLEVVMVRWTSSTNITDSPDDIFIFQNEPIPPSGPVDILYSGTTLETELTLDDYLVNNFSPDVCKTMTSKDNMLLIGNVKQKTLDLNFDCRAFRYTSINPKTGSVGRPTQSTYWDGSTGPNLLDDINPDQEPTSWNNYLYQSDGQTLGGSGPNISYKFIGAASPSLPNSTYTYRVDYKLIDGSSTSHPPAIWDPVKDPNYIFGTLNGKTYRNINYFPNSASPAGSGVLKSYQRGETYRFGIVFYDKFGNPGFTNWIADIKFPDFYMPDLNQANDTDRTLQFPLMSNIPTLTTLDWYANPLGIEFTVNNLDQIRDKISGYSIVRVKRDADNKTVFSQGAFFTCKEYPDGTQSTSYGALSAPGIFNGLNTTDIADGVDWSSQYGVLVSPETTFVTPTINVGDFLEITGTLSNAQNDSMYDSTVTAQPGTIIFKNQRVGNPVSPITPTSLSAITRTFSIQDKSYLNAYLEGSTGSIVGPNVITNKSFSDESFSGRNLVLNLERNAFEKVARNGVNSYIAAGVGQDSLVSTSTIYSGRIKRTLSKQYGGNTLSERSRNEYIYCNNYETVDSTTISKTGVVFGGDVWVNVFDFVKDFRNLNDADKTGVGFSIPTETYINIPLREGTDFLNRGVVTGSQVGLNNTEDFRFYPVFNNEHSVKKYFPKPIPFIDNNTYDSRVYASNVKTQGELSDSWLTFPVNQYRDVESIYGPINNISTLGSQFYFWQDSAFGTIPVNRRVLQVDQAGIETQLGSGDVLEKHNYISTKIGSKHQWSILPTDKAYYWYDVLSNKQIKYDSNGLQLLSDNNAMHSFFETFIKGSIINNDNPILNKGICTIYDYVNNEAIFTFLTTNNKKTLVYSELINAYTSFYTHTPNLYISDKNIILSQNPSNLQSVYIHNKGEYGKFYGVYADSYIKFLTNENPKFTKVFNTLELQTEVLINNTDTSKGAFPIQETINKLKCSNDYQDSNLIILSNNEITRKFRSWFANIPRDQVQAAYMSPGYNPRLRDKYLYTELYFTNNNNKRFILHDVLVGYLAAKY